MNCVDCEVTVSGYFPAYTVRLTYHGLGIDQPGSSGKDPCRCSPACVSWRPTPRHTAARLPTWSFTSPPVLGKFAEARALAAERSLPLRLRLDLDAEDAELHLLHWETLVDPTSDRTMATDENTLLSRFITPTRPPSPPPPRKQELSAFAVIANPSNLEEYSLPSIDVAATLAQARRLLPGLQFTVLDPPERATVDNIMAGLHKGCDVFYLAAHGAIAGELPVPVSRERRWPGQGTRLRLRRSPTAVPSFGIFPA